MRVLVYLFALWLTSKYLSSGWTWTVMAIFALDALQSSFCHKCGSFTNPFFLICAKCCKPKKGSV